MIEWINQNLYLAIVSVAVFCFTAGVFTMGLLRADDCEECRTLIKCAEREEKRMGKLS